MSDTIHVKGNASADQNEQAVSNPYTPMSEEEIYRKLETSRKHADQGMYRDADEVIKDMRKRILHG